MENKVKMSRRDFLKIAAGATGAGLLVACGVNPEVAETVTQVAVQATGPEEVTIFFWDGPPLIGIREEALTPFSNETCKINFTSVPGGPLSGYNDKLFTLLAAGQAPDVFIIEIGELPGLLAKDQLLDLKPYIDAANYDLSQLSRQS